MSTLHTTPCVTFTAPGRVEPGTVRMPPPQPREIQIRTLFSGISSGTEGWALRNEFTWQSTLYPCIPGYQRVGIITALGEGVAGFKLGQRVFATVARPIDGIQLMWGGHLGLANSLESEVFPVPPEVDDIDAANAVVAQVGYNAASRLTLERGSWVAVYGDGLIGQAAAQAARARGYRVILIGHRDHRLALGARFSADHVLNRKTVPVPEAIRSLTQGEKILGVLDSVQTVAAQREYLDFLEPEAGEITYCGFTPSETWADMAQLQQRQLTTHYVSGWSPARLRETLRLMAEGRLRLKPLMTHILPAAEAPKAYALIESKSAETLGLTLNWKDYAP